jgi:haloacid dehalogenase superfamily, subfamily IA, variant 3 with third motif having DD or ED/haloacid dehalogenase superfamily, subfamily IA, variant 1 with third motif having Dx(3-4)D or Dx(3-4)E
MKIKAVLLDMDGTLVDAFGPIILALNRTLKDFGLPPMSPEAVKRHTGRGECSMIALFGEHRLEAERRFLTYHDRHLFDIRPLKGAGELIEQLREKGIACAIVTSKHQTRAERQLAHLGWLDKIDAVIGLTDGRRQKPDPHTLELACASLNVPPTYAVMVGDGVADMKAARRAGILPLGLAHIFSTRELREAGAARCFSSLSELRTWILNPDFS